MINPPLVKAGTKHSLQMPMICTEIMEMGNVRKHEKIEWKRSQKIAEYGLTPVREDIILKE